MLYFLIEMRCYIFSLHFSEMIFWPLPVLSSSVACDNTTIKWEGHSLATEIINVNISTATCSQVPQPTLGSRLGNRTPLEWVIFLQQLLAS